MSEPLSGRIVEPGSGPDSGPRPDQRPGSGDGTPHGLLPSRWAKAWIVPVVFGGASVVLGALVLVWPGHTVGALTALFGLFLLLSGLYRFAAAIQLRDVEPVARVVALVLSVLSIGVGVVCLIDPFSTASTFAVVAGAFWLAAGAISILGARQRRGRGMLAGPAPGMAGGWFSIVVGVLIVLFPGASLVFLAVVLGLWLIFFGFSALATGLIVRRVLKNAATAVLYWP
jgi:uncharacterized membrane protein HdeD (DUF308 family)